LIKFVSLGVTVAAVTTSLLAPAVSPHRGAAAAAATSDPDLLVTGDVVSQADGTVRPAVGAEVYVWWVPGLEDAQPGDELPIETVATTSTSVDGRYAVTLAPTPAMEAAAATNGGWVNLNVGTVTSLETGAMSGERIESTGISRRVEGTTWAAAAAPSPVEGAIETFAKALGRPSARVAAQTSERPAPETNQQMEADLVVSKDSPVATTTRVAGQLGRTSALAAGRAYCSFVTTARPQRRVSVVEFHNASNSNASWSYGQSADSDIEAGIDYSGNGGWTVGATRHVSNRTSSTVSRSYAGGDKANNYGRTDFDFVDGYYKPYGNGATCHGTSIPVNTKVRNPVEWVGGVGSSTASGSEFIGCDQSPQSGHRTSYPAGTSFERSDSSAAKIGGAVDIGPISLGATSGYSTQMDMKWVSKRGKGIWLCGTNYGVTRAGVIHAQNRS
jgi:hypothetical protein